MHLIDIRGVYTGLRLIQHTFATMADALQGALEIAEDVACVRIAGSESLGFRVEALPHGVSRYQDDEWFILSDKAQDKVDYLNELTKREDYEMQYGDLVSDDD